MAIIVKHLPTGNEYIFLGISPETAKNSFPSRVLGDFFQTDEVDKSGLVAVCNSNGQIIWLNTAEVIVIEVDGQLLSELLPETVTTPSIPLESEGEGDKEGGNLNEFPDDNEEDWI